MIYSETVNPSSKKILTLIIAAYTILALCYSFATKLKYGPDEPAHFIYIRSIATTFSLPAISHTETPNEHCTATHEGHQPPLYYLLMAVPFAISRLLGAQDDTLWRILRLANIPIGAAGIWMVYLLAKEYFAGEGYALTCAAFVAGIPTASYMAGVINNENLITVLFTWAMIPLLRYFKTGEMSRRESAKVGVLIGLALLTKAQSFVLIFLMLVAAAASLVRRGPASWKDAFGTITLSLGTAAMVSGWWFARNIAIYGTPTPHSLYNPVVPGGILALAAAPALGAELLYRLTMALYGYFWVPFWIVWPFVGSLRQVVYPIALVNIVVLGGLFARFRRGNSFDLAALGFLLLAPLMIYVLWLQYILTVDQMANLQGRLFLSTAAIAGIVWIIGLDGLLKSAMAKLCGIVAGCIVLIGSNAAVIYCALRLYAG
ncbi:MAG: DUF2142 domain-containing protein [Armatimonadota bacterium]|nr:DUF2142 domain-containing protein [Armatimonadota bacterium]